MQQWTLTPPHGTSTGPGSDGPPHGPPLRRVAVFWIRKVHARSGAKGDRELPTHPMHSRRLPKTHGTNSHLRPPAFAGYRAPMAVDADLKFATRNSGGKASHQPRRVRVSGPMLNRAANAGGAHRAHMATRPSVETRLTMRTYQHTTHERGPGNGSPNN